MLTFRKKKSVKMSKSKLSDAADAPKVGFDEDLSITSPCSTLSIANESSVELGKSDKAVGGVNRVLSTSGNSILNETTASAINFNFLRSVEFCKTIATLIFFDLETTGLSNIVGKSNVQVTELAMLAVDRNEFCESQYPDLRDVRIVHKLCLCVKPRSSISSGASKITGLDNFNLSNQEPFDQNTALAITSFLSHLQKPMCLLAHNGNKFDFPILKAEFLRLNIQLPSDFHIVDTLVALRKIGIPEIPEHQIAKSVVFRNGRLSYALENLHVFFFGKKHLGCHNSEGDCIALAKVCHKMKDKIIPWIDQNHNDFDTIVPLW